jgi:hypothetical protein
MFSDSNYMSIQYEKEEEEDMSIAQYKNIP